MKIITPLVVLWFLALSPATHALSGGPIDGQVLEFDKPVTYMKPFTGTGAERLQYLRALFGLSVCQSAGSSEQNFYPLLRAAYQEAKPLATSVKQKKELRLRQEGAASTWLALPNDAPYDPNPLAKVPDEIRRELE